MRLGIIGGGRAAWAFGNRWRQSGEPLAGVHLRRDSRSSLDTLLAVPRLELPALLEESDLVLVAVRDSEIAGVAAAIARHRAPDRHLFHVSGCIASSVLGDRNVFSLHPLRALPAAGVDFDTRGTLLVFEGSAESLHLAQLITATWGGRLSAIDAAAKPLYHAAAVFAANYTAVVLDLATRLMTRSGVEVKRDDIAMLALSAIENWRGAEGLLRFTGPLIRGDRACVESHIVALWNDEALRKLYADLAKTLLETALREAPERADLQEIQSVLTNTRFLDSP